MVKLLKFVFGKSISYDHWYKEKGLVYQDYPFTPHQVISGIHHRRKMLNRIIRFKVKILLAELSDKIDY